MYTCYILTIIMVQNMKKKVISLLILALLIVITINIQAKTTKISNENVIENNLTDIIDNDELTTCTGLIYGKVGNSHGVYNWTTCPFALVTTGIRRTRCNFYGEYKLSHLPLNRLYKLTAHFMEYKPTEYVKLTTEEPVKKLNFDMYQSEPVNIEHENKSPACFGFIYGITGGVYDHASWPVGFTTLEFGNRKKISGYFGFYTIGFLRIGETYSITASKKDYIPLTLEVTLTAEKPIQWISFFMWPDLN